ncbi:arginine--tRNA ligase [Seleniivibrio sp.]|uniref:arginine--tRNA ligase n=1 Tax=Seleniivibrio sp. TaxID=2898801 RepID=UPI0025F050EA|nr:arginine--tRNA ligase [Seleniivibrio sp.]MCD8552857.1 arginine--tRNA ligase [Seleniivibrio sp.]
MLRKKINHIIGAAFSECGYEGNFSEVINCKLPELGDFSSVGALPAAKLFKKPPRDIAQEIVNKLSGNPLFENIRIDGPGYINMKVTGTFLTDSLKEMLNSENLACTDINKEMIIVDYGGANVAKPLHVGHLRSAIIGECIKRVAKFRGHDVVGDVHLGDWGLQMGMIIHELELRHPEWAYFDESADTFPMEAPVTIEDLETIYPTASKKSKEDEEYLNACRKATTELHSGRKGYRALWRQVVDVSIADLKSDYSRLLVNFDLWLGESDAHQYLDMLIDRFIKEGYAKESDGALIIEVAEETDNHNIPPVILRKSDGAALYHATDIATIYERVKDYDPDTILYVVDKRQSLHFEQIFRCVRKTQLVRDEVVLKHVPFGTMNGTDGKPFKTREGGTLKLKELITTVTEKALSKLVDGGYGASLSDDEKKYVAECVGIAALKFGDLSNTCARDYIFELDRFLEFEGKTGPYLLYSAVRAKSILAKAEAGDIDATDIKEPVSQEEFNLMLALQAFPEACETSFRNREPMVLCEYGYNIAATFSSMYAKTNIIRETDPERKKAMLALVRAYLQVIEAVLDLLGIKAPERM